MLRSMYSGISGMKNFQTKLDVLGNNIANVNTYGYKKGRTTFKDLVSQQVGGATAPVQGAAGGVNAKQIGIGSQVGTIDTIQTSGSIQSTGRPLDVAISGDGYFVVSDGTSEYYTRAGNFYLDSEGALVTGDGLYVQGTNGNITIDSTNAKSYSIGANGTVNIIGLDGNVLPNTQTIKLAKFANNEGLQKAGGNLFADTLNAGMVPTQNITPGTSGTGTLISNALEMSNVDLSEEFTEMIVAQRGFQANTRIITTSDEILQELVNLKR
ncbi:flagellar basal body rod protein FlgG [Priestia aryabhattai]|uniref:flagellar basal body rod protein FlgG n=1 Tax=Priestia aryabhattai TaxID=412384 RepID=UPI001C8EFCD5|nr:flagellar basal body rod protein FlgG [Priestia aryabhattai]MBY0060306.1 flagellar basal body rod protein FlgG [Priestia aryabhattai]MCL9636391.1 flagellar basal body rod protein FlgG [Bacillus zanthoxyli]